MKDKFTLKSEHTEDYFKIILEGKHKADCLHMIRYFTSCFVFIFIDTGLTPYTQYEYKLIVVNDAGRTSSPASSATTTQDKPEQVSPPVATVQPGRLDTIYLSWSPPTKPNGTLKMFSMNLFQKMLNLQQFLISQIVYISYY